MTKDEHTLISREALKVMIKDQKSAADRALMDAPRSSVEPNTKRTTDDFEMIGLSPLGQKAFERYQEMLKTDLPHEAVMQKLMQMACIVFPSTLNP